MKEDRFFATVIAVIAFGGSFGIWWVFVSVIQAEIAAYNIVSILIIGVVLFILAIIDIVLLILASALFCGIWLNNALSQNPSSKPSVENPGDSDE